MEKININDKITIYKTYLDISEYKNEGDLIIMNSDLPHVPATSHGSTKDRIVIAGNVGFEFVKKIQGLI
jgi:hypothetical protein